MSELTINTDKEQEIVSAMNKRSDTIMFRFLLAYSLFGISIAYFYDTWTIGFAMAGLCMISWFGLKALMPDGSLHRYVASAFLAIFVGSFIYQMHGLFEMHFFAFIGSAILIVYQNWRLQIPLITVVVLHHATFAYLQFSGLPDIYFTQLQYMDLQTFIFHASLAAAVVIICGYWAYRFRKMTILEAVRSHELNQNMAEMNLLNQKLQKLSKSLQAKNTAFEDKNKELEESKQKLLDITEKQAVLYKKMLEGNMI